MTPLEALQKQRDVYLAQRKVLDATIALIELQISAAEMMGDSMPMPFDNPFKNMDQYPKVTTTKPALPFPQVMCGVSDGIMPRGTKDYVEHVKTNANKVGKTAPDILEIWSDYFADVFDAAMPND